nr:RNA-directed DNA polymerase, eukaryota [Tanacetum cinerariifolium]
MGSSVRGGYKLSNELVLERLSCNIFITNFPMHLSAKELWNICAQYGTIQDRTSRRSFPNRRSIGEHDRRVLQDYLLENDSRLNKGEGLPDDLPNRAKTFDDVGVIDRKISVDMTQKAKWKCKSRKKQDLCLKLISRRHLIRLDGIILMTSLVNLASMVNGEGGFVVAFILQKLWSCGLLIKWLLIWRISIHGMGLFKWLQSSFPSEKLNPYRWEEEMDKRKMTWDGWHKVLAQKQYDGLGVSSLASSKLFTVLMALLISLP